MTDQQRRNAAFPGLQARVPDILDGLPRCEVRPDDGAGLRLVRAVAELMAEAAAAQRAAVAERRMRGFGVN